MKKYLFYALLFLIVGCNTLLAQEHTYPKHIFLTTKSRTDILNWRSYDNMQRDFLNSVGYAYFFHKNWGAKISYQSIQHGEINLVKHIIYMPNYPQDVYDYIVLKHTFSRHLKHLEITPTYKFRLKKHELLFQIGLSYRHENKLEVYKEREMYRIMDESTITKQIGYCASISYQYSIFRNFGVSAEAVFRQSKDIPNTFSYGIGVFYQIWNKRKEKKD